MDPSRSWSENTPNDPLFPITPLPDPTIIFVSGVPVPIYNLCSGDNIQIYEKCAICKKGPFVTEMEGDFHSTCDMDICCAFYCPTCASGNIRYCEKCGVRYCTMHGCLVCFEYRDTLEGNSSDEEVDLDFDDAIS